MRGADQSQSDRLPRRNSKEVEKEFAWTGFCPITVTFHFFPPAASVPLQRLGPNNTLPDLGTCPSGLQAFHSCFEHRRWERRDGRLNETTSRSHIFQKLTELNLPG